jgi:ribosome-associated protein
MNITMNIKANELLNAVIDELNNSKALNIQSIDVKSLTTFTNYMIVASGTSSRHVLSIANNLVQKMKAGKVTPCVVQGDGDAEWLLVDLGEIVVHIMQPRTREYYNLEQLWSKDSRINASKFALA